MNTISLFILSANLSSEEKEEEKLTDTHQIEEGRRIGRDNVWWRAGGEGRGGRGGVSNDEH